VREAEIYYGDRLEPGLRFVGPAIVEDAGSTVVVHPGHTASLDAYGNIHIERAP
jgi:N-methylhydantoinase A